MLRVTALAIKYCRLYPLASNNISVHIMINKEKAKCTQIVYQKNGVVSNSHFLFSCDDLANKILDPRSKIHTIFVRFSITVKRHHDLGNFYNGNYLVEVTYSSEV